MLSDIAIRRPVLAITVNLILVVIGLAALSRLSVRELPDIDRPVISISVSYIIASFLITLTIRKSVHYIGIIITIHITISSKFYKC